MTSSDNLPLNELEKELLDPNSECYLENLLDVVSALVSDCDFPSAKNSKSVQSFLKKYSQAAKIIESRRTKYNDFELIKVIGQGGFGRVELARHKRTRRVYAIKLMSKQHLLDHSQSGYWEERDVMVKASSEWLVACHYAFLDKDNVYLCMEYMPGGDLYYWLEKYDTFDETIARFYLAETVLALEALHELGFIHRDLKPDNMLLDAGGHLKLADFGSCVRVGEDGYYYCTSPIGTPDYISPEMLSCQAKAGKIGPACDWWALGVIAYEMFFGEPAFYGQSLVETYSRILGHEKSLRIPTDADPISSDTELFIKDLLKSSTTRLGSFDLLTDIEIKLAKNNRAVAAAQQVKSHAFFKSIHWEQLRSENAPIQPVVNSETDTSNINFDERDLSSDSSSGGGAGGGGMKLPHSGGAFAPARPQPPAYFTGSNLSFAGFTFNRYHRYLEMFSRNLNNHNTTDLKTNNHQQSLLNETLEREKFTEQTLNELKQSYQHLECQSIKDQISLKDLNRRYIESQNEIDQLKNMKVDLDHQLNDLYTQLSNIQYERESIQNEFKELDQRYQSMNLNLDNERRDNSILKTEKEQLEYRIHQLERELKQKSIELDQIKSQLFITSQSINDPSTTTTNTTTPSSIHQDNHDQDGIIIQQNEMIHNLKHQNTNLLKENEEVQEKCTTLMNLVTELRYNLEGQIKELTEQLHNIQELNNNHLNKYKETYELLEQSKLSEENIRRDLLVTKENLEVTMTTKRSMEEQLIQKEVELSMTRIRLRNLDTNLNTLRNTSNTEILRLKNLLDRNMNEIDSLSKQLDEMRNHCSTIETTNNTLTERIQQLQKDKDIQQRNLDTLVEKFYSEMKSRTLQPPPKSKLNNPRHNNDEYKQLEKKYKNLQSTSHKDIHNLHNTIDQYKKDLAERNQHITQLTEQYQLIYKELIQQKQLERNLRTRLNYYVQLQLIPSMMKQSIHDDHNDPDHHDDDDDDPNTTPTPTLTTMDQSIQSQNPTLILPNNNNNMTMDPMCGMNTNILSIVLEDIVDIDSKGRGKNKLIWLPKYVVLKRFSLLFYTSKCEYESNPSLAEEIPLYRIMHVREATELDLIHAKKEDLNRTIQLFYQNPTKIQHHIYDANIINNDDNDNIDLYDTSITSSIAPPSQQQQQQQPQQQQHHQSLLKLSSKSNQDITTLISSSSSSNTTTNNTTTTNNNNSNTIQWMNHNFQIMRFHLGNVLCDICHKNCSDLLNPPKALECLQCRMRIHIDHIDKHEKFVSCHNATNVRYIRMSNSAICKLWIEQLMYLRQYLKELQQTNEQTNIIDNHNTTTNHNHNIVHMNSMKSLYRSIRAGSLGPTSLSSTSITTPTPTTTMMTTTTTMSMSTSSTLTITNQKSDFQSSFRKKLIGPIVNVTNNITTSNVSHLLSPKYNKSPRSLSPSMNNYQK